MNKNNILRTASLSLVLAFSFTPYVLAGGVGMEGAFNCRLHEEAPFATVDVGSVDACDAAMPFRHRKNHIAETGGDQSVGGSAGSDPDTATHNPRDCIVVEPNN
ncbi:hypothetical protein [Marinicella litoralis]|uniref:Uncharacterized protein n=1 Tax=Marinicella litoralis TaxID=644220 RepID=A0A4R6XQ04_9GAMM|nr:hypothetical protein [Marinicella litoralis]TDR20489.1 hypothetical protein C8D91_1463 [Marinicella litoralis]